MTIIPLANSTLNLSALFALYDNCFGHGDSAQEYDSVEINKYLHSALSYGLSFGVFDNETLVGTIVNIPIEALKADIPKAIKNLNKSEVGIYIAELMVNERWRGRGLGKSLLEHTINFAQQNKHENLIIRVWDQNKSALTLYRHAGFIEIAEMFQTKTKPQSGEIYEMRKVYLHRTAR